MIDLDDEKNYFILIDGQGATFGQGRIFEGLKELAEQFQEWADTDDYAEPTLKGWTIGDCIENWVFELKEYDGADFVPATDETLNYIIK